MEQFYTAIIGLRVLQKDNTEVRLGMGSAPIVTLHHTPALDPSFPGDAGLYHLAIVFASRSALVKAVQRVLTQVPHLFAGSADHLVSEAFYVSDPEGNGIELYYDKDPSTWKWENGMVQMASLYIPPQDYIRTYSTEKDIDESAHMGHVHLKVGSIEKARQFYVDTVGFTVTAALPSALFVSLNGYHHHLGMNSWESEVATARRDSLGLRSFQLELPRKEDRQALKERLEKAGVLVSEENGSLSFADPWNNQVVVRVENNFS